MSQPTAPSPFDLWFADEQAKEHWQESCRINCISGYGFTVNIFAFNWMLFMQKRLVKEGIGELATIAPECERQALNIDPFGLTGFQYGCVVSIIAQVWKYGDELRRWHNFKTQIGNEGETANESGGVLNPALLRLEVPGEAP